MFLAQQSEFFELLQSVDSDFVGVMLILTTIFSFVTVIVFVVTVSRTIQSVLVVRSSQRMVEGLLAKGYSVDEVERLVYGHKGWNAFSRMVGRCRDAIRRNNAPGRHPAPPVKMPV